jgi:hypothetical protein
MASIHFLPSDVERMVDAGGLGTLCLASGKAPDPSPGVDGSGWVCAVQGKKKKIGPVGLVLHAIK